MGGRDGGGIIAFDKRHTWNITAPDSTMKPITWHESNCMVHKPYRNDILKTTDSALQDASVS